MDAICCGISLSAFVLYGYLQQPLHSEHSAEDGVDLVDGQATLPKIKEAGPWQTFAKIIDRVLFAILFIVYIIMIVGLIPEGYIGGAKKGPIEIIGYWKYNVNKTNRVHDIIRTHDIILGQWMLSIKQVKQYVYSDVFLSTFYDGSTMS